MDRVIVYDGALPQTTDVLNAGKFALIGQALQNQALLGSNTVVAGLGCTPTLPSATLAVVVGAGSIYQQDETDATAYGDLGTDTSVIIKQGILRSPVTLSITPPSTSGFSQVYLVEAVISDVDAGSAVLNYYNSANPASPFSGPANAGTSNFTTRTSLCAIALKAGIAAATGSQVTPTPDAGYVGLFAVTVANAQTMILSTNIVQLPTAPFFPTLPAVPAGVMNGSWVYAGQDTGTANTYVITFTAGQPIPTAYVAGMGIKFKALNANTGASTINVNGLGAIAIRRATGVALASADINSGQMVELTYDGTVFQMQNYLGAGATSNTSTIVDLPYVADTGTTNAIVATFSPAITSGSQVAGLAVLVKLANNITGACTINVNGLGLKNILQGNLSTPPPNVYVTGQVLLLTYDGAQYQISSPSLSISIRKQTYSAHGVYSLTVPAGVTQMLSRVWGAGGGGAGCNNNNFGSGGSGGGFSESLIAVSPAQVLSITVGQGGTAGNTVGSNGGTGGTSFVNGYHSASGGQGGQGQMSAIPATSVFVPTPGTGSSGNLSNLTGGTSSVPVGTWSQTYNFGMPNGSSGGGAPMGGAGGAGAWDQQGQAGVWPGGGGGGADANAYNGGSGNPGGTGADGGVEIIWVG